MGLLDILFPKRCVGCGRIGKYFCASCRIRIRYIAVNEAICPVCARPAIDGATHPKCRRRYGPDGLTSFFRYDGVIRKAVKSVKYRLTYDLSSEFISLIDDRSVAVLPHVSALVPIPLSPQRMRERGFNQAAVLGKF